MLELGFSVGGWVGVSFVGSLGFGFWFVGVLIGPPGALGGEGLELEYFE